MSGSISQLTENEDYEPQLTSDDPNERKLARRLRIEKRLLAIQKASYLENATIDEQEQKNSVQVQVRKSTELLEKFIIEAEEYITNVRIANDSREVDRREIEGTMKERVFQVLEEEAESEHQKFEEIAVKWSVIQKYNDPLHINEDIANQKEKCDLLIKQKDGIISMLKEELRKSEKKFTDDQKKQNEDINVISQRIAKQVNLIRKAYQKEFELIEEVIMAERQNLIENNSKKWDELFKKQREQEIENSQKKFEQIEDYKRKMNQLREDFYEKLRSTKIELGKDFEELQKELERIKALALLNTEKLDYNYQILKKREDENLIIKSQQKRKLNKVHDVINDLKNKIIDYETSTKNNIDKFRDNIKNLQRNIIDVEKKAEHFAKVNDERFHAIWDLNKTSCDSLLQKILSTDKILYEQHMGIPWEPPSLNTSPKNMLPSYKAALNLLKPDKIGKVSLELKKEKVAKDVNKLDSNTTYKRLLKYVLKCVSDKSGFLTEKRIKELLQPLDDGEQSLVRLDQIFQSLRITNKKYIDILLNYFLPYTYCPVCSVMDAESVSSDVSKFSKLSYNRDEQVDIEELEAAVGAVQQPDTIIREIVIDIVRSETGFQEIIEEQEENNINKCGNILENNLFSMIKDKRNMKKKAAHSDPEKVICQYNHPLFLSSVYVLKALREFVMAYYEEKERFPTTEERLTKKRDTISRLLNNEEVSQFWERYRTAYDENRIRIWDALLEGLKNYHELLKDRKFLCEEVVALRKQNYDLKRLLANYNDQRLLMDPPCAVDRNMQLLKK